MPDTPSDGLPQNPDAPARASASHQEHWQAHLAELTEFRRQHGHIIVPFKPPWAKLAAWLRLQRTQARQGVLPSARARLFADAGIDPLTLCTPQDKNWEEWFARLEAFHSQFGHCNIPRDTAESFRLSEWLRLQRERLGRGGTLQPERQRRLQMLGVYFKPAPARRVVTPLLVPWEERLAELAAFKTRFGHCKVPESWPENRRLSQWLTHQRYLGRRSLLSRDRHERLAQLGVDFGVTRAKLCDVVWTALHEFHARFGHGQVPPDWPENPSLAGWLTNRRRFWRYGKLSPEEIERLTALAVRPEDPPDSQRSRKELSWDRRFEALRQYKERFGHCEIPHHWPEDQPLANWLHAFRRKARRGELRPDHRQKLLSQGVDFSNHRHEFIPRSHRPNFFATRSGQRWEAMFNRLVEFQRQHGHCRVPSFGPATNSLYSWLRIQCRHGRAGRLAAELAGRLQALGVSFAPSKPSIPPERWEVRFAELEQFKVRFGHCRVPYHWTENRRLATWLARQRRAILHNRISLQRRHVLEQLGVAPRARSGHMWERRYQVLSEFWQRHGHCHVPQPDALQPGLSQWLSFQRLLRREGKLSDERIQWLDAIGFDWERQPTRVSRTASPAAASTDANRATPSQPAPRTQLDF